MWDDVRLCAQLIKVCPHISIVGFGDATVWNAPGVTAACDPVFKALGDQRVTIINPMHGSNNIANRYTWYFVKSSHNV